MARLGLIGVPSSAGAHGPGQEKAPSALRKAGLLGALREAGLEVEDLGDLPVARFTPDPANRKRQSGSRVVKVARQVADTVAAAVERDLVPLVLGGDCTITLARARLEVRAGDRGPFRCRRDRFRRAPAGGLAAL